MLVGHNIDYPENGSHAVAVTIIRVPTHGLPSLCHTWAGIVGTYEGMNSRGLVTVNQFSETDDNDPEGMPIKMVNRMILDHCARPAEAVEFVRALPARFREQHPGGRSGAGAGDRMFRPGRGRPIRA